MNIKDWIRFTEENIMTKRQVQEYIQHVNGKDIWPERSFQQAVAIRRLKPVYVIGEGKSMVRFFLRSDVEEYKKQLDEKRR